MLVQPQESNTVSDRYVSGRKRYPEGRSSETEEGINEEGHRYSRDRRLSLI
jgi:hypothetical protein